MRVLFRQGSDELEAKELEQRSSVSVVDVDASTIGMHALRLIRWRKTLNATLQLRVGSGISHLQDNTPRDVALLPLFPAWNATAHLSSATSMK